MKTSLSSAFIGVSLAALAAVAVAQTTTTTPSTTGQPAAVGVSPQTAAEANDKAIKRAEVGTVVRTSPSAADKARQMKNANGTAGNGMAGDTTTTPTTSTLPARADRN